MIFHLSFIMNLWIRRDSWITEASKASIILKNELLVNSVTMCG